MTLFTLQGREWESLTCQVMAVISPGPAMDLGTRLFFGRSNGRGLIPVSSGSSNIWSGQRRDPGEPSDNDIDTRP